ncbi:hypothetical protein [Streptomyces sp. NPDC047999]|uniref:hypothetical protein n=1 Tax=Streptomyces sp. NPDC047999 TaxID=3365497 RepID=UPI003715F972
MTATTTRSRRAPGVPRTTRYPRAARPRRARRPGPLRTWALCAAALAALPAAGGCGIRETDVIAAGGPATVDVLPAWEVRMLLFLRTPEGAVVPVPRETAEGSPDGALDGRHPTEEGRPGPPPPVRTVTALLAGPDEDERRAGLDNDPTLPGPAAVREVTASGATATLVLGAPVGGIGEAGLRQLVCTVAHAQDREGDLSVVVTGSDGPLPAERCAPLPAPAPTD